MDTTPEHLPPASNDASIPADWLVGGGEMGELIRSTDWSATPLGPRLAWPQFLRCVVNLVVASGHPMAVLCGSDLRLIYNDAYRVIAGDRHPQALGRSVREVWPETWEFTEPIVERVMARGETVHLEDQLFRIAGNGHLEDRYFTLSFSPVRTQAAQVAGTLVVVLDTTDRVLLERHLRQSNEALEAQLSAQRWAEERLVLTRFSVEKASDGVFWLTPDGRIVDVNEAACRSLGHTREELLQLSVAEVDAAFNAEAWSKHFDELRQYGVLRFESEQSHRSGRKIPVEVVANYVKLGDVERNCAFVRDITDRRQAEEELRKSAFRLGKAEKLGRMGSWEWDIATGTLTWSEEVFRIYGLDPSKDVPSYETVLATLPPDLRDRFTAAIEAALVNGRPFEGEYEVIRPDGSVRHTHTVGEIVRDAAGVPVTMFGMVQDITERKLAELSVREAQERFQAVFDNSLDGIAIVQNDVHVLANHAHAAMFGYEPHEVVGKRRCELVAPDDRPRARAIDASVAERVFRGPKEFRGLRKDGSTFPAEITVSHLQADGKGPIVGIIRDITDRKGAEEALRKLVREKEALLKEVHHRVKNNLQVIASLLRLEAGRSAHPPTRTVLADMQGRIRSMALLHESLYRSGTFAAVNLDAYLEQLATQAFRALAVRPGAVQLHMDLAPVQVVMDQAIPCGLLVNELVSNSLKHGFPNGRPGEVRVELQPVDGGPQVRLCVSDNGVGLPADFESRRRESLGLQLVSDLVGQLGGTLAIEPGPAAAFVVTFPVAEPGPSANPA